MKVALTADLQLAEYPRHSTLLPSGISSRLQDIVNCFDWIVAHAAVEKCERLIVAGDFFNDRVAVPVGVIDTACLMIRRAVTTLRKANRNARVQLLIGNHDALLRSPQIHSLRMFEGNDGVQVFDGPSVDEESGFAFVPWMEDDGEYAAAVDAMSLHPKARFLVSHGLMAGAVPAVAGRPLSMLQPDKFEGVFLGDVHEPVELEHGVRYCGAPLQFNFGDVGGQRGFWVLDTATLAKKGHKPLQFFENKVSPRFYDVAKEADLKSVRPEDRVRITTTDSKMQARVIAAAKAKTEWVQALDAPDEPTVGPRIEVSVSTAPEEALRSYCTFVGLDPAEIEPTVDLGLRLLREPAQTV